MGVLLCVVCVTQTTHCRHTHTHAKRTHESTHIFFVIYSIGMRCGVLAQERAIARTASCKVGGWARCDDADAWVNRNIVFNWVIFEWHARMHARVCVRDIQVRITHLRVTPLVCGPRDSTLLAYQYVYHEHARMRLFYSINYHTHKRLINCVHARLCQATCIPTVQCVLVACARR